MTRSKIDGAIGTGGGGGGGTGPAGPQGPPGPTGATGTAGANGVGVPVGGGAGQVLAKNTATDFDTGWTTPATGGVGVSPSTWDANSIVKADVDDTPIALTVGASTLVGRGAAGAIAALTPTQAKTILGITSADVSGLGALATKTTIVDADVAPGAAIGLSKLAVDPLARANHTGTQLAATISDFDTRVRTSRLDQMAVPTGPVSLGGQDVTNANWAGTPVPITAGGTGATTAATARSALGIMNKYNTTIGDGVTTSFTLNHGLNRTAVAVELYDIASGETVAGRVTRLSSTQIRVDVTPAPASIGVIAWA